MHFLDGQQLLLGLKEEDSPVGCLQFEYVGLLLIVYSLYGQGMMHADGVFQVLLRQGLLRFVLILHDNRTKKKYILRLKHTYILYIHTHQHT